MPRNLYLVVSTVVDDEDLSGTLWADTDEGVRRDVAETLGPDYVVMLGVGDDAAA